MTSKTTTGARPSSARLTGVVGWTVARMRRGDLVLVTDPVDVPVLG